MIIDINLVYKWIKLYLKNIKVFNFEVNNIILKSIVGMLQKMLVSQKCAIFTIFIPKEMYNPDI